MQVIPMITRPNKVHPITSQPLRRTTPNTVQAVKAGIVKTTLKNESGKNRNGPQRHIFELGAGPAMMPPVLGNNAINSNTPSSKAPATRNHRNSSLPRSILPSRRTKSSPTAAGTGRWQRIQRPMNRLARLRNRGRRFVWSDHVRRLRTLVHLCSSSSVSL